MKQLYTFLLVVLLVCTSAFAQDSAKMKDIKELLRLTKAGELAMNAIKANLDVMRKTNTNVPAEVWIEFEKGFSEEELITITARSYDKHFTHQEVKDLIALYKTPLGQKLLEKTPLIMQESMEQGQEYGRQVAMRVMQKMQAEGKLPNK